MSRLRCRLGLHRMVWETPGTWNEPPEPGYVCDGCDALYPDVQPLSWRIFDWFYGDSRLGVWLVERRDPDEADR